MSVFSIANHIALVATLSILEKSVTEQNLGNYAVFCRQKDNRTCERA